MKKIKILLADDHQIFLEGLMSLLEPEKDIEIVGIASNGLQVIDQLERNEVDIVVLDINMPYQGGVETAAKIKNNHSEVKILALTMHNEYEFIAQLKELGAKGYILKNRGKEELVEAIHQVHGGKEYFGKEVIRTVLDNLGKPKEETIPLTEREEDVLRMIGNGHTTPEISDELCIAHSTVETHRRNLLSKLGLRNSLELVKYSVENGYTKEKRKRKS